MFRLLFIIAIVAIIDLKAYGQQRERIDSLLKELPRQKKDTNKINLLNSLSKEFIFINPDTGIIYGKQALNLAANLQWRKGLKNANNILGRHYSSLSNYPVALDYYFKSLKLCEESGDKRGMMAVLPNIVRVYQDQGEFVRMLELNMKALKIAEELGDRQEVGYANCGIANSYFKISDFPNALTYALRALKIQEELGDKMEIARVMLTIGNVYGSKGDYPKSREYYMQCLKLAEEAGSKEGVASVSANIGSIYSYENKNAEALEYYLSAIKLFEELGDAQMLAQMSVSIGSVYAAMGDYSRGLDFEFEALKKEEELGARPNVCYALSIIGTIYLSMVKDTIRKPVISSPETQFGKYKGKDIPASKKEQLRLAIRFLERSRDSAAGLGLMDVLKESNGNLVEAYRLAGQHKKALDAYREFVKTKDSLFNMESEKKIVQQQLKYDYDKREDSLKLVNTTREKEAALRYQRQRSYTLTGAGGILVLAICSVFMFRNNKLLTKEKNRSEDLLLNMMPVEVAGELKNTGSARARHFDNVTVLFTDFVNFTEASGRLTPQGLIDELHTCFQAFDEITHKHNIEKIKTIGDAYLAICGLPSPDPDHAANVIRAAIEINEFMENRLAKLGSERTFAIRIGVHSGSVIAGIVGVKKFAYDIWGDTVNTAAQMEQNSIAGRINISSTTYELVKDKFHCEYRGAVEVKGKGMMQMYFVENPLL